jgi:putative two-component system response regulator
MDLDVLEQALRAEMDNPSASAPILFTTAFETLRSLPDDVLGPARVRALLAISVYYYAAARPDAGLTPALEAARVARLLDDRAPLRNALKILSVMYTETGNLPSAMEACSEALDQTGGASDPALETGLWNNVGNVHLHACQYADAIDCFERAHRIAEGHAAAQRDASIARGNIAIAALHCGDLAKGLRAVRAAIRDCGEPGDLVSAMYRVDLENCATRLLLEAGEIEPARRHAALAGRYARRSRSGRAEIIAELALALCEVHAGDHDDGLLRMKRSLARARDGQPGILPDALGAAIKGYEVAGQPDVALVYLRELLRLRADARQAQILMHHTRHLATIDHRIDDVVELNIERRQAEMRDRLCGRDVLRARVAMLEQNAVAGELHDDATGEHCYRVGRLASLLAREYGVDDETCFLIDLAARLHDIGKLAIPDVILLKPGKLTAEEFAIVQTHTTHGADLLAKSRIPQMHVAEEIARGHHERWDGNGYPNRLRGSSIPLAARITALADVFDALTHARPYKTAWTVDESLREIGSLAGKHFDPQLTAIFMELVPRLQREHGDLDAYLAVEAQNSPFIKARREIAAALKGENGAGIDLNAEFNARR